MFKREERPFRQAWCDPKFASLVERPSGDPEALEIWCYADRFSYKPGEVVGVHVHTTRPSFWLKVIRDGATPQTVLFRDQIEGQMGSVPDDPHCTPLDWPVATTVELDPSWQPGFYLLIVGTEGEDGTQVEQEGFFVLRASDDRQKPRIALILTTSTLLAYNDWGGANHYRGIPNIPWMDDPAPVVCAHRPIARGILRVPVDAPHHPGPGSPGLGAKPEYPTLEYAFEHGFSRHYADTFWAMYERQFVCWAESAGYELDYLTQHDLHFEDHPLEPYDVAVLVGHDEYWTWEMRDAADRFVDEGGMLARFGGNIIWQVRLSDDGAYQTCYKIPSSDPYSEESERRHLTTTGWDWQPIDRPAAETFGLSGLWGCYNRFGAAMPRSSGGYTIYRPDHWAFEDTGLVYGDLLGGAPVCVAAFELDGLDYTFRSGLPYPTDSAGAPESLQILAMAPATLGEVDAWDGTVPLNAHELDAGLILQEMTGDPDIMDKRRYGSGMIASFERGRGEVFNAGTTEWVNGLHLGDPFVDRITRNVLDRGLAERK